MVFYPDGRVELVPMKAVPTVGERAASQNSSATPAASHSVQDLAGTYRVGDGWLTPERLAAREAAHKRTPEELNAAADTWEQYNKEAISAYNRRIEREGSMGWRLHDWRKKQTQQTDAAV
jgi:hypothetical protein